jgi:hypothetical protein
VKPARLMCERRRYFRLTNGVFTVSQG